MGRREAFDPLRSYVANRDFTWGGKAVHRGDPFDDRRDMRRFRQLYDTRYLCMSEVVPVGTPDFKHMPEDQLREWLVERGYPGLAHPRSTRQRLIERCQRLWLAKDDPNGVNVGHVHPQGGGEGVQGPPANGLPVEEVPIRRQRLRGPDIVHG